MKTFDGEPCQPILHCLCPVAMLRILFNTNDTDPVCMSAEVIANLKKCIKPSWTTAEITGDLFIIWPGILALENDEYTRRGRQWTIYGSPSQFVNMCVKLFVSLWREFIKCNLLPGKSPANVLQIPHIQILKKCFEQPLTLHLVFLFFSWTLQESHFTCLCSFWKQERYFHLSKMR